jgi:Leucine-rich repeat (LRR) protein
MDNVSERIANMRNGVLDLSYLDLTELPPRFFEENLPTLKQLWCGNNAIEELPQLPITLQFLDCSYNALTKLPPLPPNLLTLRCYNNALTELPPLPPKLEYLECNNNMIMQLPTLPPRIRTIHCSDNALIELPTLPFTLSILYYGNNPTRLPFDAKRSVHEVREWMNENPPPSTYIKSAYKV